MHIITVEGLGSCQSGLHPVQEALAQAHGSQCGFCTPGFVMSMYALLRSNKVPPSEEQIEECLSGNLCRCTGYRPIIDAFRVFAKTDNSVYTKSYPTNGEFICPSSGKPCSCREGKVHNSESSACGSTCGEHRPVSYNEIDGSLYKEKELIFPPELVLRNNLPLKLHGFGGIRWYRPLKLKHLLDLKSLYPAAKLVVGNTEVGIEVNFKNAQYPVLISVSHVPELNVLSIKENGLEIGSSVRLSRLQEVLKEVIAEREIHETSSCRAISDQLKWFAGKQVKNVASVGGNICTASPISDLNPLWMAARADFNIVDSKGNIRTVHAKDFFLGYRKVDLAQGEILHSIFLPWSKHFEFVKEFKQSHRREDDIALVNAGMRVYLEEVESNWQVSDVSIIYGGVAAVSLIAAKTENFLIGKTWDKNLLQSALKILKDNVPLAGDAPGGMVEFRKSLILSFFFKFFLWVTQQMNTNGFLKESMDGTHLSAIQPYSRPCSSASQNYEITSVGTAVGLPVVHQSAKLQV
ncbi:xanthine dehydrogenase-like isoform X2 [Dendrobium catenatum]|nr:xanthine dehydrogenase-like isoform X2 [Dendrobium catenatum]